MTEAWNAISSVRGWANDLKHKRNIEFDGEYIEPLYNKKIIMQNGENLDFSKLEPKILNMDSVINELVLTHNKLVNLSHNIFDFINYDSAVCKPHESGFLIPEAPYKKVILPNSIVPQRKEIEIIAVPLIYNENNEILLRKDKGGYSSIPSSTVGFERSISETISNMVFICTGIKLRKYKLINILHFDKNKQKEKQIWFCYKISSSPCTINQNSDDKYWYYWSSIEQAKIELFSEYDKCCLNEIDSDKVCEKHIVIKKSKAGKTDCYDFL